MTARTQTGGRDATRAVIPGRYALSVGKPNLPEPVGFRWRLLTSLARLESGHTPSRKKSAYWDGEIPWIGIRDATENHGKIIKATVDSVAQEGLDNSSARLLPRGTVCLSRTASVGYVVEMGRPMATSQDFVNWVPGPELNGRYLRYLLMSEQESVRRFAHGTTHQTMYYPEAKALHVLVPARRYQDAVADVLGALEDKIAANDRLVTLVDDLLRSIFQRLATGHAWSKLSDIGDVNASVTKPQTGGSLRYLDISAVGHGTYEFPELTPWSDAPGRARRVVEVGDTVWSTVRPKRRSHALILDDDPSLIASTGLAVLSPHRGRVAGLYEATRTGAFIGYLESVAEGSAYPAVRSDRFLDAPVPSLEANEWERFEDLALPTRRRAHAAVVESRSLTTVRDELLPLLMSGKVRVKDAEKVVEEVT